MAGHSKWANIQHRKGRQDEKRGKAWTRVIREIMVAARLGGGDVSANPRLRLAIEKAKAVNLPVETVKRNIDKATGNLEGVSYEEIRYEGIRLFFTNFRLFLYLAGIRNFLRGKVLIFKCYRKCFCSEQTTLLNFK